MIQATTMTKLEQALFPKAVPDEVVKELLFAMFRIEREFGENGNVPPVAFVLVAESGEEHTMLMQEFGLNGREPDDSGLLYADAHSMWLSFVYADEGGGEVNLFVRHARECENDTHTARNAPL